MAHKNSRSQQISEISLENNCKFKKQIKNPLTY